MFRLYSKPNAKIINKKCCINFNYYKINKVCTVKKLLYDIYKWIDTFGFCSFFSQNNITENMILKKKVDKTFYNFCLSQNW